jgi:hypothetical protein
MGLGDDRPLRPSASQATARSSIVWFAAQAAGPSVPPTPSPVASGAGPSAGACAGSPGAAAPWRTARCALAGSPRAAPRAPAELRIVPARHGVALDVGDERAVAQRVAHQGVASLERTSATGSAGVAEGQRVGRGLWAILFIVISISIVIVIFSLTLRSNHLAPDYGGPAS